MASGSKESDSSRRQGFPKIRGKKRKLFCKETKRLVDQLSGIPGQDWVEAIVNYATENELHLQIFPERDALHKKIIAQCASELGSFLEELVKKYLELYTKEWGASAALVFSFIGYVGRTLNGETKSSDLWLSIIDGEDKETARHIGNMYGLALMYQVDKFIEKQKRTGTAEDEAFCQSAEPDDYTCVSLTPKSVRVLTPRRRRIRKGSELNPSQSTGHKYAVAVTSSTPLINASTRTSKKYLNTTLLGTSILRRFPFTRHKKAPECINSTESVVPTPPSVPSISGTSNSVDSASNYTPSVASKSSAVSPFPIKSTKVVSDTAPSTSSTCITFTASSNLSSANTPTVLDTSTKSISATQKTSAGVTSTKCVTSTVTRASARFTTTPAAKISTRCTTSTATDTSRHINPTYRKISTRQKTTTQPITSVKAKTSAVPDSFIRCSKPAHRRTSTRRKTHASPVNSTRSGRIPKKKVVLDL